VRYTLALVLLCFTCAQAATPWEEYLDFPSPDRAQRVSRVSYTNASKSYEVSELQILERQVLALDVSAFRLTYRLTNSTAPGGLLEDLLVVLSKPVRGNPAFFLRQVSALDPSCKSFEVALNMAGLEYTDRLDAYAYEMSRRREAIAAVKQPALSAVKQECLKRFDPVLAPNTLLERTRER
jgi:hypothetical protein